MRLPKAAVPLLGLGLICAAVAVAMATNTWVATGRDEVKRKVVAGTMAPEDIKGWMTLQDVATAFALDPEAVAREAGLPASFNLSQPLREAEREVAGFEMDAVRTAVASLSGRTARPVPRATAAPANEASDPAPAPGPPPAAAPAPRPAAPAGRQAEPATPVVSGPAATAGRSEGEPGLPGSADEIRGTNTLAEVAKAFGVTTEWLKGELGFPADSDVNRPLREFKSVVPGFEVERVREVIRSLKR